MDESKLASGQVVTGFSFPQVALYSASGGIVTHTGVRNLARGVSINPQITVAMNNEKLYGFIISQQHSNIKSMESCDLPEGMTDKYSSNRSSVLTVLGDKVYTCRAE